LLDITQMISRNAPAAEDLPRSARLDSLRPQPVRRVPAPTLAQRIHELERLHGVLPRAGQRIPALAHAHKSRDPLTVRLRLEHVRSEEHTSELQSRENLVC